MDQVNHLVLAGSLAFALWIVYPLACWAIARLCSRRLVADAETMLKGA